MYQTTWETARTGGSAQIGLKYPAMDGPMLLPTEGWLLFAWLVIGAAWFALHLELSGWALRTPTLARPLRWFAWIPPLAPWAGWIGGRRFAAGLWVLFALSYVVLRAFE